ncbi:NADH-quinone oxidoreductase subunit L [Nonomuraea typhae]|uniref:NADH-quinone oxidoreductase subunit 5 family protein n=1 Tax=Nonomuraea typhae TaxID=2603600 RepID=UPI0012F8992E|nr:proton-conducting transporter membrane subunit [Nonomuraea typhae]
MIWILPAAVGALLLLVRRAPRAVALTTAAATLALAVWAAIARPAVRFPHVFISGFAVDGLSAVMVVTVAAVALAVLVFAAGELREARFYGLMLVFVGAMLATVTATELTVLLMGWEVMGAMSYALIGYWWRDDDRVTSAGVAFLTTRAGDLGLYVAAGAALAAGGRGQGLWLDGLAGLPAPWRDLVAAGVVLAALGKSAQLPFSFWLSRAMAGPSPVSALLHSATMVAAGAYLLMRLQPLLAATGWAAPVAAWAGGLTALLLGAVAVAQRDLKQLLAASTCAQIGLMMMGSVAGGAAQLVAHAAVKSLLFLGAGAWLTALGTKDLAELGGAARRYPVVGVSFTVGALALAGVPPLSLWVTKDTVLASVAGPWLHAVGLAAGLLSAAYAGKALASVWRGAGPADGRRAPGARSLGAPSPGGPSPDELSLVASSPVVSSPGVPSSEALSSEPPSAPVWTAASLPPLAVAAAVLGVAGVPVVWSWWSALVGDPGAAGVSAGELVLSGGLAVGVLAVVLVRPGLLMSRRPGRTGGWLGLEALARAAVWRPLMGCARALAWFDDRVVDGAVGAVPKVGMAAARAARMPFEAGLDGVVRAVAGAALRLGRLARRPQNGQVHTYFAQAAVGLIILALAIVLVR